MTPMETASTDAGQLFETSKRLARRLLAIGENRFELLMVEVQDERERLLHAIVLALGVAALGLPAVRALTAPRPLPRPGTMRPWWFHRF